MEDQLYKGGDVKQLKNSLVKNNILILLSDQDAKKKGLRLNFLELIHQRTQGCYTKQKK